jgi:hypothetical protein
MNPGLLNQPDRVQSETWFYAIGPTGAHSATRAWQQWRKPKGCTFIDIFLAGGGGAGGAGASETAGASRGGGGGGAAAATVRARFAASMIPDVLWIQIGRGGKTAGQVGARSLISMTNAVTTGLLISGAADAAAGTPGSATGGGGGGVPSAAAVTTVPYTCLALSFTPQAGVGGTAGGSNAVGVSVTPNTMFLSGGAGGGGSNGVDRAGGNINAAGIIPAVPGGAAGGGDGNAGFRNPKMGFMSTGGSGGGSLYTGAGGAGGAGALACGGGGAGAGLSSSPGGPGGDGFCVIWTS